VDELGGKEDGVKRLRQTFRNAVYKRKLGVTENAETASP
jgi:hypothetical protein